ncbi:MAG: penicillin acylase family protein [Myxococcota bacterium]
MITRLVLGRRLPKVDGEVCVDGLNGRVTLRRDAAGVLYVDASTDEDAWFGLGFGHGQDRAGQLEVVIRLLRGTLAEVLGPEGVAMDLLTRRLQVHRAGAAQYAVAEPQVQRQFDAYAAGINAAYAARRGKPSHEHVLLGCPGTTWRGEDCQTFAAYLCFMLAANWDIELLRLRILEADGPEAVKALDPLYPKWLPSVLGDGHGDLGGLDRLTADLTALTPLMGLGGGSNAWALSSSRTATGRPILANDPHLIPSAPSQWYLARLKTPNWKVAGGSFVGTAAMGSGHNAHVAWGVTAGHADHTDLFLEQLSEDGMKVREGDAWVPCEVREEVIAVKGAEPIHERVMMTARGPLVGESFKGQRTAMSLSGTWLAPRPYSGIFSVHRAASMAEVQTMFEQASTTNVGLVYAHREGDIGYLLAADIPVRRAGYGLVPRPGWLPDTGWEAEPLPPSALPRFKNPARGFIAAANAKPCANTEAAFLGEDWLDGYRLARIEEALEARDDWDLESTAQLQMCTLSLPWRELRGDVLSAASSVEGGAAIREVLEAWDGRLEPDAVGATLFQLFLVRMIHRVLERIAPNSMGAALGDGATELLPYSCIVTRRAGHLSGLLRDPDAQLFGETPREVAIAEALSATWRDLHVRLGPPSERWAWGTIRPMVVAHPFAQKAALARVFNIGPVPGRGDASTVHQGSMDLRDPAQNVIGCATMRSVIDVGAWENSRFVVLGGQSGNPCSPHYEDHVPLWERGEGVPIHWTDDARDAAAVSCLTLKVR